MDNLDRNNIGNYQANTIKLLFARMSVPVHATDCQCVSIFFMEMTKKVVSMQGHNKAVHSMQA